MRKGLWRHIALIIFLLSVMMLTGSTAIYAQSSAQSRLEAERKKVNADIANIQNLLDKIADNASALLDRLNLQAKQILARKKSIDLLNQQIALIDRDISKMNTELDALENDYNEQCKRYVRSLQNLQTSRRSHVNWLFILSADNFTQSIRRMRYLREYAEWRHQQAKQIIIKQEVIKQKKVEMEASRKEKTDLLGEREKEHKSLQVEESTQKKEYDKVKRQRQSLEQQINQKKKHAEQLDKKIEKLIADEIAASKKDKSVARKSETVGGYEMTTGEKQLADDFKKNRGELPYPLTGKYRITRDYGQYQPEGTSRVWLMCNGIEIGTTQGTDALAVFKGEVTQVFQVDPGVYSVIVRHGEYLTIYINLSEVYVRKGDKVTTRQKLGRIYTNPTSKVTMLHFEIRKEKITLNPKDWLK